MRSSRKASITFIFITILIDIIGIGIIIPVLPKLLESLLGTGLSDASRYGGWLIFSFAFMQFLFAPVLGILSDKFGRRPIILMSLVGLGINFLIHAVAPTIGWLFLGRILAGLFGSSFTVATAYIADISTPEKKAQNFGLMGAAFGLGFIIGPLMGGIFAQWGVRVPFYMAALLSLLNVVFGYFVLPESLSKENRRPINWKRANPISALLNLRKHGSVIGLVLAFFIVNIAGHSLQSTWSFITMFKFEWDEAMVGYSLAIVGLLVAIVQGGLIKYIVAFLGQRKAVYMGFTLWIFGLFYFSMANNQWFFLMGLIPYCLGGIAAPTVQGIVSNSVPDNEQGELQGAMTSVISIASIIGPLLMTNTFYRFTNENAFYHFPGAPFFLGGLLLVCAFFIAVFSLKKMKNLS